MSAMKVAQFAFVYLWLILIELVAMLLRIVGVSMQPLQGEAPVVKGLGAVAGVKQLADVGTLALVVEHEIAGDAPLYGTQLSP